MNRGATETAAMKRELRDVLSAARFIPVLTLENVAHAVPAVRALVDGGLNVVELTLRTDAAEQSLVRVLDEVPEAVVGVGTVVSPEDVALVERVKPAFAVSPGVTSRLLVEARGLSVPLLPGIATPSELMLVLEEGYRTVKFFPAEASGGPAALRAFTGPFPDIAFCPTGGIGQDGIEHYLSLANVAAVGGSWLVRQEDVARGKWKTLTDRAREVRRLVDNLVKTTVTPTSVSKS